MIIVLKNMQRIYVEECFDLIIQLELRSSESSEILGGTKNTYTHTHTHTVFKLMKPTLRLTHLLCFSENVFPEEYFVIFNRYT